MIMKLPKSDQNTSSPHSAFVLVLSLANSRHSFPSMTKLLSCTLLNDEMKIITITKVIMQVPEP